MVTDREYLISIAKNERILLMVRNRTRGQPTAKKLFNSVFLTGGLDPFRGYVEPIFRL